MFTLIVHKLLNNSYELQLEFRDHQTFDKLQISYCEYVLTNKKYFWRDTQLMTELNSCIIGDREWSRRKRKCQLSYVYAHKAQNFLNKKIIHIEKMVRKTLIN